MHQSGQAVLTLLMGDCERGNMLSTEDTHTSHADVVAGEGELRCTTCGYAVAVASHPDTCPMCQGTEWDAVPWRPFSRESTRREQDSWAAQADIAKVS